MCIGFVHLASIDRALGVLENSEKLYFKGLKLKICSLATMTQCTVQGILDILQAKFKYIINPKEHMH